MEFFKESEKETLETIRLFLFGECSTEKIEQKNKETTEDKILEPLEEIIPEPVGENTLVSPQDLDIIYISDDEIENMEVEIMQVEDEQGESIEEILERMEGVISEPDGEKTLVSAKEMQVEDKQEETVEEMMEIVGENKLDLAEEIETISISDDDDIEYINMDIVMVVGSPDKADPSNNPTADEPFINESDNASQSILHIEAFRRKGGELMNHNEKMEKREHSQSSITTIDQKSNGKDLLEEEKSKGNQTKDSKRKGDQIKTPTKGKLKKKRVNQNKLNGALTITKNGHFLSSIDSKPDSPFFFTSFDEDYKSWKKSILLVYDRLASHKYASVFSKPITENEAPNYHQIIFRPMDLSTIKRNIENGLIRTTVEFQRDLLLILENAIIFNKYDTLVYRMAEEMGEDMLAQMEVMVKAIGDGVPLIGDTSDEKKITRARTSKSPSDAPVKKKRKLS